MNLRLQNLKFLYVFTFFTNLMVGMLGLALPLFAIRLGAGNISLGALGTLASFIYIIAVPFSGWLADRLPKNLQAGAGAALFGLTVCAMPFMTKLAWLYPLVAGYIIGLALLWPSLESALCKFTGGRALAKSSGWYNVSWSSGATIGYLVSGYIWQSGPSLVFWIAGGGAALLGLVFIALFRAPDHDARCEPGHQSGPIHLLYLSWLANGMVYFVLNILRNIFPKLSESLGFSSAQLGLLLLCLSGAQCIIFIIFNLTSAWHFKFWPLIVSMLVLFAGLVIVFKTERMSVFLAGFLMIGAAGGMSYSASLYYAVSLESKIAGARSGWHEFYVGVGGLFGPIAGGLLAHFIGPKSPYAFCAAMALIVLAAEILYHRSQTNSALQAAGKQFCEKD